MIDFNEYSALCETLTKWAEYYAAGNEVVSDDVYNANYLKLKEFEAANPAFILDTSPTRRVIDGADGFRKVKHEIPMISIANSNGIEEATEWVNGMIADGVKSFELEYKLDGLGLALIYKDGVLVDSVTRGVDNVGDSVWENALQIPAIPHNIQATGTVEIRGEVVWKFDDFNAYNEELIAAGKKALSNPRNGATGTLKLHNPIEVGKRNLYFVAYIVARNGDCQIDTQEGDVEWLEKLGFATPPHYTVSTVEDFRRVAEQMREARFEQDYAIDGIVIKVNDKSQHADFGYTAKTPNFYRAYKFPPEEKTTVLIDIEQSGGMSGAITPVAILEPVHLAMTTVQRCTLHNWNLVEYLGLTKGCHVVIRKAGEIIPEIVKCEETGRSKDDYETIAWNSADVSMAAYHIPGTIGRPSVCPFCGGELHNMVNSDGAKLVAWVCSNEDCQSQMVGKLVNFVSRTAMNIKGLGDSIVELLYESGKVRDVTDFYKLSVEDLCNIGNIREKYAAKLIAAIDASRSNDMKQLIEGLSVPGIGHQVSQLIAGILYKMGGVDVFVSDIRKYGDFIIECLNAGISELNARKFANWARDHADILIYFATNHIATECQVTVVTSAKLAGKVCIMTGTFDSIERDAFKTMVVENGGTICSGITKKTNLVLLGDNAGPKKVQAIDSLRKAGQQIEIYTPDDVFKFFETYGL